MQSTVHAVHSLVVITFSVGHTLYYPPLNPCPAVEECYDPALPLTPGTATAPPPPSKEIEPPPSPPPSPPPPPPPPPTPLLRKHVGGGQRYLIPPMYWFCTQQKHLKWGVNEGRSSSRFSEEPFLIHLTRAYLSVEDWNVGVDIRVINSFHPVGPHTLMCRTRYRSPALISCGTHSVLIIGDDKGDQCLPDSMLGELC